jgi:hypothetical protein
MMTLTIGTGVHEFNLGLRSQITKRKELSHKFRRKVLTVQIRGGSWDLCACDKIQCWAVKERLTAAS